VKKPLVSIVIPNYNYSLYVREAVDSALAQIYPNIEVVVSDNASTDDSWKILQRYKKNPKVRLFRQDSTIPVGTHYNFVSSVARGQYQVLFSSDDVMLPGFVEKCMKVFLQHPERTIGFVAAERNVIDADGNTTEHVPFYNTSCIVPGEKQAKVFLIGNSFVPSQIIIDYTIFCRAMAGKFDFRYVMDNYWWFQMCLESDFGYVRDKLVLYRQHFQGEAAAHMGGLRGVFELYLMRMKLIEEVRLTKKKHIVDDADAAMRKVGTDCIKWAEMFLEHNDPAATRRLLHLGAAIDEGLPAGKIYKALEYALNSGAEDPYSVFKALTPSIGLVRRDFSYDPPKGFIPIKI
jgi:glycosyltransferase involved in cell wall biosynthesis